MPSGSWPATSPPLAATPPAARNGAGGQRSLVPRAAWPARRPQGPLKGGPQEAPAPRTVAALALRVPQVASLFTGLLPRVTACGHSPGFQ